MGHWLRDLALIAVWEIILLSGIMLFVGFATGLLFATLFGK